MFEVVVLTEVVCLSELFEPVSEAGLFVSFALWRFLCLVPIVPFLSTWKSTNFTHHFYTNTQISWPGIIGMVNSVEIGSCLFRGSLFRGSLYWGSSFRGRYFMVSLIFVCGVHQNVGNCWFWNVWLMIAGCCRQYFTPTRVRFDVRKLRNCFSVGSQASWLKKDFRTSARLFL